MRGRRLIATPALSSYSDVLRARNRSSERIAMALMRSMAPGHVSEESSDTRQESSYSSRAHRDRKAAFGEYNRNSKAMLCISQDSRGASKVEWR